MTSIKKVLRNSKTQLNESVSHFLRPLMGNVGKRLRLEGRIRLLNKSAAMHSKLTCVIVILSLTIILGIDLTLSFNGNKETNSENLTIASIDTVIEGYGLIQHNKDIHRLKVNEMTAIGKVIQNRLDSLLAIPNKSRADSIEIKISYRRLEMIVNHLNPECSTTRHISNS